MTGSVLSINISEAKGTVKKPVASGRITMTGLEHDGHAEPGHRQVSLLSCESTGRLAREAGKTFQPGDFAENITTTGIDLTQVRPRDLLRIGPVELEVTQIGKECHGAGCAIAKLVGKCVMPKEGVFARVRIPGNIAPGDPIEHLPRLLLIHVITLSDRASRGEYADRSGPAIREKLQQHFAAGGQGVNIEARLLPDEAGQLRRAIEEAVAAHADMIFTTGGTGIGPRDITPEVVRPLLDKEIPGIMEFIRTKYGASLPSALLSRSVAGLIGSTLIYTLPGSVKAAGEYMTEICKSLDHSLLMLGGGAEENLEIVSAPSRLRAR